MFSKSDIYNQSIIIIGPVGVGKSLVAEKLGRLTNMPVINFDIMRHCPSELGSIEMSKMDIDGLKNFLERKLASCKNEAKQEDLKRRIAQCQNDIWVCDRRMEIRELLPEVPSYEEMGFDVWVSGIIDKKFGEIGWHFYQKQFESALLGEIFTRIDRPCIFDIGGGMAISLDDEYEGVKQKIQKWDKLLFEQDFNLDVVSFEFIQKMFKPFKNVVSLKLPDDYEKYMTKASKDVLNKKFINAGQYEKLATCEFSVDKVFTADGIDEDKLESLVNKIAEKTTVEKFEK